MSEVGHEKRNTAGQAGLFGPLMLLALALVLALGWNLFQTLRQRELGRLLGRQQEDVLRQAQQTERRLQGLLTDLVTLSQSDAQARAIVEKYSIRHNPPAAPPVR